MLCGGQSLNEKQINMDAKGLSQYRLTFFCSLLKKTKKKLFYMFLRFGFYSFYKITGFTCTEKQPCEF